MAAFRELFLVNVPRVGVFRIGYWPGKDGWHLTTRVNRDPHGTPTVALGVWRLLFVVKGPRKDLTW